MSEQDRPKLSPDLAAALDESFRRHREAYETADHGRTELDDPDRHQDGSAGVTAPRAPLGPRPSFGAEALISSNDRGITIDADALLSPTAINASSLGVDTVHYIDVDSVISLYTDSDKSSSEE